MSTYDFNRSLKKRSVAHEPIYSHKDIAEHYSLHVDTVRHKLTNSKTQPLHRIPVRAKQTRAVYTRAQVEAIFGPWEKK